MSPARKVVVIGAGPAGYVCAIRLAQLGQRVTVVEKGALGGTCLNVGCIPSKALISAGGLMDEIERADAMGIRVSGAELDVETLVGWKQGIVDRLAVGVASLLKSNGCELVRGAATLLDRGRVRVAEESGERILEADDVVLATGSEPIPIPGFEVDEERVWSSTGALSPRRVPGHLLVIGAGYIGLELGLMYRSLGSRVTFVELTAGALPGQDRDCVKVIERSMKKRKVKLLTETAALSFEERDGGLRVLVRTPRGEETIDCDQIACCVGRRPVSAGLGLEALGLGLDPQGFLPVDRRMRTALEGVYAIGDLVGQPMLAHKGSRQGQVAAAVIAGRDEVYDPRCVPGVVFCTPQLASVGLTEEQAREDGREVRSGRFPFAASGRAMSLMQTEGFCKVLADAETDEVVGVHMVGPEVGELIAEAALAIEMGATAADLARTIHAHPTLPEALMEAAEAVHGMAVHIFQK